MDVYMSAYTETPYTFRRRGFQLNSERTPCLQTKLTLQTSQFLTISYVILAK